MKKVIELTPIYGTGTYRYTIKYFTLQHVATELQKDCFYTTW